jgi:NADH-quinone oxidoreductase subunit N
MSPPFAAVTAATVQGLVPEILLVAAAIAIYLIGAFTSFRSGWLLAFIGVAIPLWLATPEGGDSLTAFGRWMTLAAGMALVLVQGGDVRPASHRRLGTCEEAGTFLILLAGLSLVAVADNLVLLFVGLEMVSIPTYILLGLARTSSRGQEAALKYFFLSLLASAIFLYGMVCLYGIGGDVRLAVIGEKLQSGDVTTERMTLAMLPLAVGMLMVGAAFRMAAVPMHFYAPDVYEGTSTPLAGVLSTLPKLAGVVVLVRLIGLVAGANQPAALAYAELFALADGSFSLEYLVHDPGADGPGAQPGVSS